MIAYWEMAWTEKADANRAAYEQWNSRASLMLASPSSKQTNLHTFSSASHPREQEQEQ
jgi:hypothetical protein